ncbi:MAG: hypothetical protein IJH68_00320 [Thermoguttaceae bacterium]|nr:hypothetical protein [Thermoguttaceae bacterium]
MDDIKNHLIGMCKAMMDAIASGSDDRILGQLPKVFYLDFAYLDKDKFIGSRIENPLETYRYENGTLKSVPPGTKGNVEPIHFGFFSEGHFAVAIDKTNKYAYVGFALGSLFGRGVRYTIMPDVEGNTLAGMKMLWTV